MKNTKENMTDRELSGLMDKWRVEMPDQQFFANLPAVVQAGAGQNSLPWWRAILSPLPAMSFGLIALLSVGLFGLGQRMAAENGLARAAARWASEDYGWASIDRALESVSGDLAATPGQRLEEYLSILDRGTYQSSRITPGSHEIIDNLSDDDLELLIDELQKSRS